MIELLKATDGESLFQALGSFDVSVAKSWYDRTDEDRENYAIGFLLSTITQGELLFPLSLLRHDHSHISPDFVLDMKEISVGVEVTEAVSPNAAMIYKLREKGIGPEVYYYMYHHPSDSPLIEPELVSLIEENEPSELFNGDGSEKLWFDVMQHSIRNKIGRYQGLSYKKYDKNWLIVYDNWEIPYLNIKEASLTLFEYLVQENFLNNFDKIFIMHDKKNVEFSENGIEILECNDLWSK